MAAGLASKSSNDLLDYFSFHKRQSFIAAQMRKCELVLVQTELVENRRVNVAEVIGAVDGAQADLIGRADNLTTLNAAASHPHRETGVMMVTASA